MAIKPTKSGFTLSANIANIKKPVNLTIANLKIDNTVLSSEGQEASSNINAGNRYEELYRSGLNPLKAHVIANTEFVPVATVAKPNSDASTINLNFGEESTITVTNVAKLISLHRQIREYMLNTAEEMLKRVEDFHVPAFHQAIHLLLKTGFHIKGPGLGKKKSTKYRQQRITHKIAADSSTMSELVIVEISAMFGLENCIKVEGNSRLGTDKVSIDKTVDNVLYKIKRLAKTSVMIAKNEGRGASTNNRRRRFAAGRINVQTDYISLVDLVKDKKDNALIKSLIEYTIYEVVVLDAIQYMSGILRLKDDLDDAYAYTSENSINNKAGITDNPAFRELLKNNSPYMKYGRIGGKHQLKQNLGFKFDSSTGDVEELLNVMTAIGSKCLLLDTTAVLKKHQYIASTPGHNMDKEYSDAAIAGSKVFNQWEGDLCRAMKKLRKISFEGAVIQGEEHTVKRKESERFTLATMQGIESILENEPDHRKRYGEMLAAMAFDSVYELTGRAELDLELPKLLSGMSRNKLVGSPGTVKGEATIATYLKWALGDLIPMTIPNKDHLPETPLPDAITGQKFSNFPSVRAIDPDPTNTSAFIPDTNRRIMGALGEFFTRIPPTSDGLNYIPLESKLGKLNINPNKTTYYTGPEYFIDKALQKGDFKFKEFSRFIDSYVAVAEAFASDILKLTNAGVNFYSNWGSGEPDASITSNNNMAVNPLGNCSPSEIIKSIFYAMGYEAERSLNKNKGDTAIPNFATTIIRTSLKGGKYRAHTTRAALSGVFNSGLFKGMGIGGSNIRNNIEKQQVVSSVLFQNHESFAEEMAWSMLTDFVKSGKLRSKKRKFYMNRGEKYRCVLTDNSSKLLTYWDKNMNRQGRSAKRYGANKYKPNDDYITATRGNSNEDTFKIKKTSGDTVLAGCFNVRDLDGSLLEDVAMALHPGAWAILIAEAYSTRNPTTGTNNNASKGSAARVAELARTMIFNPSGLDAQEADSLKVGGPQALGKGAKAFTAFLFDSHLTYDETAPPNSATFLSKITNQKGRNAADELFGYLTSDENSAFVESHGWNRHRDDDKFKWKFKYQCRNYGPVFNLGIHHRGIIWHQWVILNTRRYINLSLTTHNPDGGDNAHGKIHMFREQIQGFGDALKHVGSGKKFDNSRSSKKTYRQAYHHMTSEARAVIGKAQFRQRQIVELTASLVAHANKLRIIKERFISYVNAGEGSKTNRLAIATMKDNKIFEKSLNLLSREKVASMYMDYIGNFRSSRKNTLFSPNDFYDSKSTNLMFKILSEENYGFLSTEINGSARDAGVRPGQIKKERRGNKTILHVGITNSMLSTMRHEAFRETKDRRYLDSSRIAINVYKKNQLNSYELLYPKAYVFDMSAFIVDYNKSGRPTNHIENYQDSWSFNKIKENIQISRWSFSHNENDEAMKDDLFMNDYRLVNTVGRASWPSYASNEKVDAMLVNHIHDYAFKKYYKMTLGVDFSENSFLIGNNVLDYSQVSPGVASKNAGLQAQYDELARKATLMYPASNIDPKLASELFRVLSLIRSSSPYDCGNKLKRVFYPRSFDRVFSILVNEKDFIVHKDSLSKEFLDIYKSQPNFTMTAGIERPDIKSPPGSSGPGNERNPRVSNNNANNIGTVTKKYKASCFNDYPEVYSYYVNISLLPSLIR